MEVNTAQSPYALLKTIPLKNVSVRDGIWSERQELAMGHELYCAGHLFEAAVTHHRATGKTKSLDSACRFADHIDDTFGPGKRDGAPGHPEIELALVELFRESSQPRYLALAAFFLGQRGWAMMIHSALFVWQEDILGKIIETNAQGTVEL